MSLVYGIIWCECPTPTYTHTECFVALFGGDIPLHYWCLPAVHACTGMAISSGSLLQPCCCGVEYTSLTCSNGLLAPWPSGGAPPTAAAEDKCGGEKSLGLKTSSPLAAK